MIRNSPPWETLDAVNLSIQLLLYLLVNLVDRFVGCFEIDRFSILSHARNHYPLAFQIDMNSNFVADFETKIGDGVMAFLLMKLRSLTHRSFPLAI